YSVNFAAADNFTPAIASSGALLAATTTTTSTSSSSIRSDTPMISRAANDTSGHDAVLTRLASRHDNDGNSISSLTHTTQRSHEQATDALLATWSPRARGSQRYLHHGV